MPFPKIEPNELSWRDKQIILAVLTEWWMRDSWSYPSETELPEYLKLAQGGWLYAQPYEYSDLKAGLRFTVTRYRFGPVKTDIPRGDTMCYEP